jgi:transposase
VTAGQVHESTRAESVIGQAVACLIGRRRKRKGKRCRPKKMAGDKAYSVPRVRDWLKERLIKPVIPHKSNELAARDGSGKLDRKAYSGRSVVEQCVGWLKEYRRIGTRFEKLAVNFHGMLQLAMIKRYLKLLFSDRA